MNGFPRVSIADHMDVSPEGVEIVQDAKREYAAWAGVKARFAYALIRNGHHPYVKPPAAVVAKRRAKGKRAKAARKAQR